MKNNSLHEWLDLNSQERFLVKESFKALNSGLKTCAVYGGGGFWVHDEF